MNVLIELLPWKLLEYLTTRGLYYILFSFFKVMITERFFDFRQQRKYKQTQITGISLLFKNKTD